MPERKFTTHHTDTYLLCFNFLFFPRYTLLIGAGDVKDDVARASQAALYSAVKKANNPDQVKRKKEAVAGAILPDFLDMLTIILDKSAIRVKSSFKVVVGDTVLPFSVAVGSQVCDYVRLCLWNSAGLLPSTDMLEDPVTAAPLVASYLRTLAAQTSPSKHKRELIVKFIELVEKLLRASAGMPQALALLHFIGAGPEEVARRFVKKMDWFKFLLDNTREEFREAIAAIYGLVSALLSPQEFEKAVTDLTRSMKEKQLEFQHGAILALGHSFGRRLMKGEKVVGTDLYAKITRMIVKNLDNSHNMLLSAACLALAELGRCGPLALAAEGGAGEEAGPGTTLHTVTKLLALVKSGKTSMKVREKAALAAGSLCLGDKDFPYRR